MIMQNLSRRKYLVFVLIILLCGLPVTSHSRFNRLDRSSSTFIISLKSYENRLHFQDNSILEYIVLNLNGKNFTYYFSDIEKELSNYSLGYLLENDSFAEKLSFLKHMFWQCLNSYTLNKNNTSVTTTSGTSQLIHQIDSIAFFNESTFVQLAIYVLKSESQANESNYMIQDIRTITISEANATQVATHIDILESVLNESSKHSVNLTSPEGTIHLGVPTLLGALYTLENFSGYAKLGYKKITYTAPYYSESLFQELHWAVVVANYSTYDVAFKNIGLNECVFHYTLDGRLFAITAWPPIPISTTQPWLNNLAFIITTAGIVAVFAIVVLLLRKRKM